MLSPAGTAPVATKEVSLSNELQRSISHEVEVNRRYRSAPPLLSEEGWLDRKREREHVLAIRDADRDVRKVVTEEAAFAAGDMAHIQGRSRVLIEAKLELEKQQKASMAIAGDNPELSAKFRIMDDDFYNDTRETVARPQRRASGRLFDE